MTSAVLNKFHVSDMLAVEDCEQLAAAMRYFGTDLPLTETLCVELLVETLPDGSEVSTVRIRKAEAV